MEDCLFCKMVTGEIMPKIIWESDEVFAFRDIRPQAPVHVLVVPKKHIATLDDPLLSHYPHLPAALLDAVNRVAVLEGISESGYRTIINCRADSGQEVYHLHLHVLGGRRLHWPPG